MNVTERIRRRNEFDASLVYGTKRFNMLTQRDEHLKEREENDGQWVDPATGVIAERYADHRPCPGCGATGGETLFVKCGFPHVRCGSCTLVYATPILNMAEYERHYRHEDSWERVIENAEQVRMQAIESRYSLDIAELYMPDRRPLRICDVGCGPGTLLVEAKQRGHVVFGIEPNAQCHPVLASHGIPYSGEFFPLRSDLGRQFDGVFLLNALEHMRNPKETIIEIRKLLVPGGILYISVPNIDALVNRIMHAQASVFAGHSHLQFFNAKTLGRLCTEAGYTPVEHETIITQIGTIKNYLAYEDPYFGDTPESFAWLTPEMVYANDFARNINMVVRRAA